ncbi:hypothetical protein JX266_010967 [Neoarthrinium moseri]|nr:hypothetical protein JX266_010967 [Neoarthrinium moseri]
MPGLGPLALNLASAIPEAPLKVDCAATPLLQNLQTPFGVAARATQGQPGRLRDTEKRRDTVNPGPKPPQPPATFATARPRLPNLPGRHGPFPTASHAHSRSTNLSSAALDALQESLRAHSLDHDHDHPDHPQEPPAAPPVDDHHPPSHPQQQTPKQERQHHHQRPSAGRNLLARSNPYANPALLQSPARAAAASAQLRPAAARLWNPTNSTPRGLPSRRPSRRRRPSTPPPPPVPIDHPVIDITSDPTDPATAAAGDYPLLTLPELRQNRHSASTRASLQIEGRASGDRRISLPKSLRHSYDEKAGSVVVPLEEPKATPSRPKLHTRSRTSSFRERARALSFGLVRPEKSSDSPKRLDKGKGKATMAHSETDNPKRSASRDLERGPDVLPRLSQSNMSIPDGIGSAISSSNSSIMGDPDQPGIAEEWGPQHPCFPHLNPHVPINSPEYATTRIIRVKRDWLVEGDLAPTFSNLYPEILDPAGVSEQEFRRLIEKLNGELVPIFSPYNWRNIVDGVLGLLTGWIWDDMGLTNTKSRLRALESWIDKWNTEMEKTVGSEEGIIAPKIIPLRRTGYMNLDIQIPDPEIAPAASQPSSRSGVPAEPELAHTTEHMSQSP